MRLDGSERNTQFGSGVRIGIIIQAYQLDHPAGLFRQALDRLVETVQPVGPFDIVAAEVEIDLVGDEFAAVQLLPAAQRMRAGIVQRRIPHTAVEVFHRGVDFRKIHPRQPHEDLLHDIFRHGFRMHDLLRHIRGAPEMRIEEFF